LQNENDDLKNAYYKSPQYLELSARQNFGLAAPGEKELLVPKAVALAHVPAFQRLAQLRIKNGNQTSGHSTNETCRLGSISSCTAVTPLIDKTTSH
jgi:hypothetical protein